MRAEKEAERGYKTTRRCFRKRQVTPTGACIKACRIKESIHKPLSKRTQFSIYFGKTSKDTKQDGATATVRKTKVFAKPHIKK